MLDERELRTFRRIAAAMYLITILALMGIVSYRQFALGQPHQQWDDIAMLLTLNVLVVVGAFLYLNGTINPATTRLRHLIAGYVGFVAIGLAFTVFKYAVLEGLAIDLALVWGALRTILVISGLLVLAWGLLAYFGSRRLEDRIR